MRNLTLLSVAVLSASLAAQSNTVAGLDGRLTVIDSLDYYGRRGPAYPNGEIGMAMLNTMCNPGSVDIPWQAAMQPNHPKFGFLIARVHNDKIEQINEWSFCKHAFTSINVNGQCGTCQDPNTGSLMGINCSDTYGSGNNASRTWLGPPEEIDPWLGTWNPVGSYFDIGDPMQAGYPAPADGTRSLSQSIFDSVDNRVTVDEIDLTTAGASYYYCLQLIHQGEAVANRGDNNAHRGMNPSWNGNNWSFSNNAEGQQYGSVLDRWTGADVEVGQNGSDDGRFYVASKVTALGGGNFHYEYAVHNVDNSRAGGSFKLPIDAGATASNFSFGDIDTNGGNDWSAARVGNEIVFTATASNPIEWNTIYNFGFDCNFAAGSSACTIDQHRPGPGATFVNVPTKAPSGSTFATVSSVGDGCGGSVAVCTEAVYETNFDMANSSYTLDYNNGEYTLVAGAGSWIAPAGTTLNLSDDDDQTVPLGFLLDYPGGSANSLTVCSNGFISAASNGTPYNPSVSAFLSGAPRWAPLWTDLDPSSGGNVRFDANVTRAVVTYDTVRFFGNGNTATFQVQYWASGDVHVIYQNVGASGNGYLNGFSVGGGAADPGQTDISASLNAGVTVCSSAGTAILDIALAATNRPVVGTTIDLITTNVPLTSVGGLSILSTIPLAGGVDLTFLGMPGCFLYQELTVIDLFPVAAGSGQRSFSFPNNPALSGAVVYNQAAVMDLGINAFNIVTSNGLALLIGLN
tara:strand:+ start:30441 stop:32666 length:2226 start_codon:yes stop_codon:yes gene_type:complete